MSTLFFSCDWGTSSFRLRLVDGDGLIPLGEIKSSQGIAKTYELWKQSGAGEEGRVAYYQNYIFEQVQQVVTNSNRALPALPIVLSGMASSSIGMIALPYKHLPFDCSGSDLLVHEIDGHAGHRNKMFVVSGARSETDVMRGEETMLAGCTVHQNGRRQVFIFPGTHSKHIAVENGRVRDFTTYITGEMFQLLSTKSILSDSVAEPANDEQMDDASFSAGVLRGAAANLANSLFHVRTNQLFGKLGGKENYAFLSGLLIGYELKDLPSGQETDFVLVGSGQLRHAYSSAIGALRPGAELQQQDADQALIRGQWMILQSRIPG
jgi:2-dehydro-3-deoxygalactonokinase